MTNGNKKVSRLRRATKTRQRISLSKNHRLSVFKSINHIYLQLLTPNGDKVITTISSTQKEFKKKKKVNNIESCKILGKKMADYIKKKKIDKVAFDRSGYKFHGRVKALADTIRENGVKI
ncbi:MAG: 50S ribosomal protein L18 [Gammaproteobacteria bacterium]|nr:50S ribosomal protein L18 [Gammaproteobacteria bacterium]|tara:strand:- start:144 stop:503 length:360 start_codon:yes stop_codon:yes gene_type:complete